MTDLGSLQRALAGRYTIEREIGQGGMATVYLATDVRHERQVAVKVLRTDLAASIGSERFLQEIRIAARLGHPHILPLHDSGEAGGFLYYVMPYVAGESLRQRFERQGELPVSEAVRILRDVADALAFAHQHGVVHRDIKPENILLSGRHALVADFGVAKAVSEATGRQQLTTVGVALGTPAYMAPEQAVADPHVDHRADLYALGVVGYEMCAGEPPFTGRSPQQVLAAHMTEAPRHVSEHRAVLPPALGDTIMRCLEKRPADRWQSAEELLAQLESVSTSTGGMTPTDTRPMAAVSAARRYRWPLMAAGALLLLAVAAGVWASGAFSNERTGPAVVLRDRTQLTFSGQVQNPAISPDGKQLAFVSKHCTETACSYGVDVQDVGGTATRRVLDGAGSVYFIEWSPDRRHLLVTGSIDRRWGTHLVSLLGGASRRVGFGGYLDGGGASFFAGGDSLFLVTGALADSIGFIRVANLAGTVRDSVRIPTDGLRISNVDAIPGTPWMLITLLARDRMEQVVMDRQGRVASRRPLPYAGTRTSSNAIWHNVGEREHAVITRTPFDAATGRIGARTDTVYAGRFTAFSVTADGSTLAMDEGAYQHSMFVLDMDDVLAGRFPTSRRVLQGSTPFQAQISPDGRTAFVRRPVAGSAGADYHASLMSLEDGSETPLTLPPGIERAFWDDDARTLVLAIRSGRGQMFSLLDTRTGMRREDLTVPDSIIWDHDVLPGGGWIWIPVGGEELKLHANGTTRSVAIPEWYDLVFGLSASRQRLAMLGWNASTGDTVRVSELRIADNQVIPWYSAYVDHSDFRVLGDGSILFTRYESAGVAELYHLTGPDRVRRLGAIPRPITGISTDDALRRAMVGTMDYFGDVWMTRVVTTERGR